MPPWVRNIMGGLKTLGLLPSKNLPSLNKPFDRHRLSGFLYNISLYLQEMGAELEEAPAEPDEEQLWEKVLHYFLQSEGSAILNQWNDQAPPRPSIRVQDWFLSMRGSPHWDWLLGLLQSLISLSERQPQKPLLSFLSQNWRTVSAVFEATLQALLSGTYGQASAGLQGFICALKGHSDCAFNVSWLQQLLRFLETRNWKPVVSLHPAGEGAEHSRSSSAFGRFKPFSLPPEAMRQDGLSGNASVEDAEEEDPDFIQSFLLQALSRSGGGERGGPMAQNNLALVQTLDGLRSGLLHRVGSSVYSNLRKKVSRVTMALLDDVSSLVDVPQPNIRGRCSVGEYVEEFALKSLVQNHNSTKSYIRVILLHFSHTCDHRLIHFLHFCVNGKILMIAKLQLISTLLNKIFLEVKRSLKVISYVLVGRRGKQNVNLILKFTK